MSPASVSSAPTAVHQAASIFALKRSQDLQAQSVATLLNSVATPPAASNPLHLGANVDARA